MQRDNEDTFVFEAGTRLTGVVEGGDRGFDSIVFSGDYATVGYVSTSFDSGIFTLDSDTLVFDGMEPVVLDGSVGTFTQMGTSGDDNITITPDPMNANQYQGGWCRRIQSRWQTPIGWWLTDWKVTTRLRSAAH